MTVFTEASSRTEGVDFDLTEDQRAVRDAARDFALREIDPIVEEIDESQSFPTEVFAKAGELGFLGVIFPEELGGAGFGYVEYVLVVSEISRVCPGVGLGVAAHNSLCSNHIYKFGSDEQKERFLVPLASGKKIGAWSLTEPDAGSDAAGTRTRAEKVDGGWLLNGSKTFTTHGSVGDVCVVFAVTDPDGPRHHNISAFIVEADTPGFRSGKKENKLGTRSSDTAEVIMEDCLIPEENLLGDRGEGFIQALQILDGGRISIAALGLGTAQGAFDTALAYAKERQQFGQPIAQFQAIQFYLAEMATRIAASEALTFAAALAIDQGRKVSRLSSEAKLATSETAVFCAERGFIKDYRAEMYYRDCKLCTIGEGTSEIQRLVIARNVLHEG